MRGYLSVVGSDSTKIIVESSTAIYRNSDAGEQVVAESAEATRLLGIADVTVSRKKDNQAPIVIAPRSECIEIQNNGNTNGVVVSSQGERVEIEEGFVETVDRDAIISIGYQTDLRLRVERKAEVRHEGEGDVVMGDQIEKRMEIGDDNIINRSDIGGDEPADVGDDNVVHRSDIGGDDSATGDDTVVYRPSGGRTADTADSESKSEWGTDTKYCINCGAELLSHVTTCSECEYDLGNLV